MLPAVIVDLGLVSNLREMSANVQIPENNQPREFRDAASEALGAGGTAVKGRFQVVASFGA